MPNTLNGRVNSQTHHYELSEKNTSQNQVSEENIHNLTLKTPVISTDDWSDVTKGSLDSLPKVWTRGLLYFLVIFVSIVLPWAMLSKVDETGMARGRLEPEGKTIKLDAAVPGTVAEIRVKEGELVKKGQILLVLESELVKAELRQTQDKLEGQLNRLSQFNLLKNQLVVALATQRQQNQAQELEKQAQIDQAQQNLSATTNSADLKKEEKLSQVNQARQVLQHSHTANRLVENSLSSTQREVERYRKLLQEQVVPEIKFVEKQDLVQEQKKLYEQTKSDIEQAKLRLAEQQSSYERTLQQADTDIKLAKLQLQEQQRSYQTLTHSGKLAILKTEEQLKNLETEITSLKAEIAQTKSQIKALNFQIEQRILKAPEDGTVFQLPIQKAGSVVQQGTMVTEIAPLSSPLIIRAQIATNESGSLRTGLPVKLKFDAYPFQDYGVIEGKLIEISPTSLEMDTGNGKLAAYDLEISLNKHCISTGDKCIALRPGDTATAEIIVRQRRIIDFLLDPFKKLQRGGVEL
ncbi:HlyD family efflux transporter periplasmic adaptor subunit [Nostoc sp. FACHB-110]|uniref:HlyD family efflux transporter periplasmic adaptor subunit n=1 Tax=Nostoc sp. FACHB-110 TaxID=2692834 RepID=UPI001689C0AB|nr:HlyD family efflux transporter periplasmic adaptor subunit [Nostoc sp. FACHB-110]MBD2438074.1 HlyD family efflux transporter periplasmic adaptor subunit [Nostoc sp. FACHB-110]